MLANTDLKIISLCMETTAARSQPGLLTPRATDGTYLANIGDFVLNLRQSKEMTQLELAALAGVHRSTLMNLESGLSCGLDTLIRVLRVLGALWVLDGFSYRPGPTPTEITKQVKPIRKRIRKPKQAPKGLDRPKSDW
jgi:transcriptional regulator with XRE-family HTH domain